MSKPINTGICSGLMKFTFTDTDGDVFATFMLNPADIKLAARCEEISKYLEERAKTLPRNATVSDAVKLNDELEDKVCYLLGYDARATLFGMVSATTIMPDGELFVTKVVEKINEAVVPEIRKRRQNMQKAVAKHTAKYQT